MHSAISQRIRVFDFARSDSRFCSYGRSTPARGGYPRIRGKTPRLRSSICVEDFNVESCSLRVYGVKTHERFKVDEAHGVGCVRRLEFENHLVSFTFHRKNDVCPTVRKMTGFWIHTALVNMPVEGGHKQSLVDFSSVHVFDE